MNAGRPTSYTTAMHVPLSAALLLGVLCCACCAGIAYGQNYASLLEEAKNPELVNSLLKWRRTLHAMPELQFSEVNTSLYIRSQLDEMGIPYVYPLGRTGIRAGPIGSSDPGAPTIALRADMDGLPISEEVDVPYKSTTAGRMHACGHDAHMAMLLGAARLLKARKSSLGGRVVLLFQPAEEGGGGARELIREGGLAEVGAIHGLHVWPALPAGTIGTRGGVFMAASDRFSLLVRGAGGHGAMPHTARDPVVAAAAVVGALQSLVARETSPVDSAVVTVSRFNTGPGAANVIPDCVELSGTIRALTAPTFERLHRRLEQTAEGVAAGYGCTVENITWSEVPYPPTRNDEALSALVREVAAELLDPPMAGVATRGSPSSSSPSPSSRVQLVEPSMAAEDFSFYGEVVPQASFTFLGIGDPTKGTDVGLHSPRFQMDEEQLPLGAALHAAVATEWLLRQQTQTQQTQHQTQQTQVQQDAAGTEAEGEGDVAAAAEAGKQAPDQPAAEEEGEEEDEAEEEEKEDPRLEGLRKYAREKGVAGMPSWVRRMLADDPEFARAVAQADFDEGLRERLRAAREQQEQRRREREAAMAQQAAEAAGAAAAQAAAEAAVGGEVAAEAAAVGESGSVDGAEGSAAHDEL
ncbi:hypothetical protein PLESTF_001786600 [Pleodorina starrii]|nr:hypothetical protein PLESTM_001918000 [Pleodorina starrii]GLC76487.1 hypothetical protein PLESTF_001786600 [Pleodorina starrii]